MLESILILTTLSAVVIALVTAAVIKRIEKKRTEDRESWKVPVQLLVQLADAAEIIMIADGYGRSDYVYNVFDCSEFAPKWQSVMEMLLKQHRPKDKTEWMRQYSFQRDLRSDGSDPGRHRVVAIKSTEGIKYIDTYRLDGTLFRTLSIDEKMNGRYIK